MFSTLLAQVSLAITLAICLFTFAAGGAAQRVTALVTLAGWIGSSALQDRQDLVDPQYATFALDLLLLVVFGWIALRWRQDWSMAVVSFQLLTMLTHIAIMIDLRIAARAYVTAYLAWSYLLLLAVAWGGWAGWRDRRRGRRGAKAP